METKEVKNLATNILECVKTIEELEQQRFGALNALKNWENRTDDHFDNKGLAQKTVTKCGAKIYFQQLQIKQIVKQLNNI